MHTSTAYKYRSLYAYLWFLIWPFFALVYALGNLKSNFTKNIVWLFCGFFGYTFIISNPEMDANRYRDALFDLYEKRSESFTSLFLETYDKGIYSGTDFYSHGLTLTISRFTDDFRILFLIVGLVYGYFFSRNILYIVPFLKEKKWLTLSICIFVILAFLIPFWNINGYRFYTAAHVFLFGLLPILVENKYKYLWVSLLSTLFHFSFIFPVILLFIYFITRNRYFIYLPILAVSLFFTELDPKAINENAELAPIFMQNKVKGYTTKEYIKFSQSIYTGMNWYVLGHVIAMNICLYAGIVYLFLRRKKYLVNNICQSLYSFGIFFLAAANFVVSVPSMGRFQNVALIIVAICLLYCSQMGVKDHWIKKLNILFIPATLIFFIVEIRIGFDFLGLNSVFLNPFIAPFFPDSPALIDFFK